MRYSQKNIVPTDLMGLYKYVQDELTSISKLINAPEFSRIRMTVLHVAPDKMVQGDVVYADGTNWDPGSGEGIYRYSGSAWVFLG